MLIIYVVYSVHMFGQLLSSVLCVRPLWPLQSAWSLVRQWRSLKRDGTWLGDVWRWTDDLIGGLKLFFPRFWDDYLGLVMIFNWLTTTNQWCSQKRWRLCFPQLPRWGFLGKAWRRGERSHAHTYTSISTSTHHGGIHGAPRAELQHGINRIPEYMQGQRSMSEHIPDNMAMLQMGCHQERQLVCQIERTDVRRYAR